MAIDYSKKVVVRNLINANVAFRGIDTQRDIVISPLSKTPLPISEVMAQIYAGNKLFVGTDRKGSHARLYVEDKEIRIEAGFETEDNTVQQVIVDESTIKALFDIKTASAFKKALASKIKTEPEKQLIISVIQSGNVNDYDKVKMVEDYLGRNI